MEGKVPCRLGPEEPAEDTYWIRRVEVSGLRGLLTLLLIAESYREVVVRRAGALIRLGIFTYQLGTV